MTGRRQRAVCLGFARLNLHRYGAGTLHIRQLENGLRDPAAVRAPHQDVSRLMVPPMPSPGTNARKISRLFRRSKELQIHGDLGADCLADEPVQCEPVSAQIP